MLDNLANVTYDTKLTVHVSSYPFPINLIPVSYLTIDNLDKSIFIAIH